MAWEFQPTHEMSKDFEAINNLIERALTNKTVEQKHQALLECQRFFAMLAAKEEGMFDHLEGLHEALRRIRAITTNALPHNIDGGKMQMDDSLLLESHNLPGETP